MAGMAGMAGAGGVPSAGAGGGGGMAGSGGVASGGMAGSGMAGSAGAGPTGHRFARFVAKSEQNGEVWSAVAELKIFTTGSMPISSANWIISADSQETDDQTAPASAAIDGNPDTFWHTAWEPEGTADAPLPHQLTIDLVATQPITGFSYLPRQDQVNGRVASWEFFVSKDGTTWGAAVKTGSFPAGAALQTVSF
jgi:endo-alpha-N-acetylgalactosaminidase